MRGSGNWAEDDDVHFRARVEIARSVLSRIKKNITRIRYSPNWRSVPVSPSQTVTTYRYVAASIAYLSGEVLTIFMPISYVLCKLFCATNKQACEMKCSNPLTSNTLRGWFLFHRLLDCWRQLVSFADTRSSKTT